jgi:hypothetical protein
MYLKINNLTSLIKLGLCAFFAIGILAQIQAQDKKADGNWTWSTPGRNGGPDRTMTLKLKTEGDKVTGTLVAPGRNGTTNETKIEDGKLKGDQLSFTVTREFNGNKIVSKYSGKVGETIKGKIETERDGETQSRDWEAKRATEAK